MRIFLIEYQLKEKKVIMQIKGQKLMLNTIKYNFKIAEISEVEPTAAVLRYCKRKVRSGWFLIKNHKIINKI